MKHYRLLPALALAACGAAHAQLAPANALPKKPMLNGQAPAEGRLPSPLKGYGPAQIPTEGKADSPGYAGGSASDETKALLKAQTEAIKALSAKVEGLEARLAKVEAGRK
jgi:hypothetical protein